MRVCVCMYVSVYVRMRGLLNERGIMVIRALAETQTTLACFLQDTNANKPFGISEVSRKIL